MFGIIDNNKKFVLLDSDHDKLRATALMLVKEETVVVDDIDYETGNKFGEHSETHYVSMFNEETVDEAIEEYAEADIETSYNGEKYLKGHAPQPTEYEKAQARIAELKQMLADADYWTSKRADGEYTDEEWAEKVAIRKAWRTEINELEKS